MGLAFRFDEERMRFIGERDGTEIAFARLADTGNGTLRINHVEVLRSEENKGHASALMKALLEDARARGKKVVPVCPFAGAYLRRHPEYEDLQ
ncbi:GNAT family N-acetyltransferase [Usitatibacter palustris]|uniref:Uncharacterized protein n=1 Tax=Usitatibacter palustris TaxID=2732487 RepID=A0A6M4HBR6_9PROT|nr:GNAT family N-acetyltransferase [Usitatibacter palustris]QJR16682.1 hypothetical protein DSM104440_03518 [Usitatibacter palustris]